MHTGVYGNDRGHECGEWFEYHTTMKTEASEAETGESLFWTNVSQVASALMIQPQRETQALNTCPDDSTTTTTSPFKILFVFDEATSFSAFPPFRRAMKMFCGGLGVHSFCVLLDTLSTMTHQADCAVISKLFSDHSLHSTLLAPFR
jgi:hypothetical protein